MLECDVSPGVGILITSTRQLSCVFHSDGKREFYTGEVRRFGLDIGVTGPGKLVWAVVAIARSGRGALAGQYVGASAAVTVGVGVGANTLVGGFQDSFMLQPVSVEVQTGASLTAGIGSLELEPASRRTTQLQ